MRRLGCVALAAIALAGCAPQEGVVRVVDGRPHVGAFVPAEAYAAYLRAAIADAAQDLPGAVQGYAIAATLGPNDPEPWARLGDARCRLDPRDSRAGEAIAHALSIDGDYAPALAARAMCAERRGETKLAVESARRAAKLDPEATEPLATLASLERDPAMTDDLRARLIGMTLVAGTDAAAWGALATWARGHGDAVLEARALARVAALAPSRRREVDASVLRLAGDGDAYAAQSLALARAEPGAASGVDPVVARMAIDASLAAGDVGAASRIATHAHVPVDVVAARALLLGDAAAARALAEPVVAADPGAVGARLVLAAAAAQERDEARLGSALAGRPRVHGPLEPEVWTAFGRVLARQGSVEAVRVFLREAARAPLLAGDALTTPLAVDLAAAGVLDPAELGPNARVELAERRAEALPDAAIAGADARHTLLALARGAPLDARTLTLARRLAPARTRDAIVAVAFARIALAGAKGAPPMAEALSRFDPADPLVAAAALDCAVRSGDFRTIPLARARLAAVAHTAAERARLVE